MIPKIVHYVWVGPNSLPVADQARISNWERVLPDWEIRAWGNEDLDFSSPFVRQAFSVRAWNRVSDYTRMDALCKFGGVYLDADVDVVRSFNSLLVLPAFVGFQAGDELPDELVNGAVFGSEPGHWLPMELRRCFNEDMDGRVNLGSFSGPGILTKVLRAHGLQGYADEPIEVEGVTVFPKRFFYPYSWKEQYSESVVVSDTIAVHRWAETWIIKSSLLKRLHRKIFNQMGFLMPNLALKLARASIRRSNRLRS